MITNARYQPSCGGPALWVEADGRINVDGHGYMLLSAWPAAIEQWRSIISSAAASYGVPEAWIASVIKQESGGNAKAASADGGIGLMQITDPSLYHGHTRGALFDPAVNVDTGAGYLRTLGDRYAWNPVTVAAAYNAGGAYCWTGRNCASPGLWNLNVSCGYVENVIAGINTAISRGYSGTGASSNASSGAEVFAFAVGVVVPLLGFVWWRRR